MPSSLSFSYGYTVEFTKGCKMCDSVVALKINGMCDCVFLCFKAFLNFQFSSVARSFDSATPWTTACQASLSITNS